MKVLNNLRNATRRKVKITVEVNVINYVCVSLHEKKYLTIYEMLQDMKNVFTFLRLIYPDDWNRTSNY